METPQKLVRDASIIVLPDVRDSGSTKLRCRSDGRDVSIVLVLGYGNTCSELCAMFCDKLAC